MMMRLKAGKVLLALLMLGSLCVSLPAQDDFYQERFSLYGYAVNLFNVNLYADGGRISDSDWGSVLYGRLKGDWSPEERLSFHAELAYRGLIGNQNPLVVLGGYGLSGIDQTDPTLAYTEDLIQSLEVDHLWGSVNLGRFDLQFGKLPIAWGTGYFFNPTSRAAAMAFLDTVSEETRGTLAVMPSASFLDGMLSLQGYLAFQDKSHSTLALGADGEWAHLPFGVRVKGTLGSFDLSAGWIKEVLYYDPSAPAPQGDTYARSHYFAADLVGVVWNFGVYAEAALKLWEEAETSPAFASSNVWDLLEICAGFDYFITALDMEARVEYYHQGSGERQKSKYDVFKLFTGKQLVLGEDYLFCYLERTFLDYFRVSAVGLVNLNDASFGVIPELSGEPFANFQVGLGAMLFFGSAGSEFNGEFDLGTPIDLTEPAVYLRCKLSF